MYRTDEAIRATLRSLRSASAAGSRLVSDDPDRAAFGPGDRSPTRAALVEIVRRVGEPMIFGFDPATLEGEPAKEGFRLLEDLGPEAREVRYDKKSLRRASADGHGPSARAAVV